MFGIGIQELLVILVIILLLFGSKKLPELSRSIGHSMKELRKGFTEGADEKEQAKTTKSDKKSS